METSALVSCLEEDAMKQIRHFTRTGFIRGALLLALVLTAGVMRAEQIDASELTLVGLANANGITYASLVDPRTGEHFLPSTRSADDGLELVSVTGGQEAVVRQNGQSFRLRLGWAHGLGAVASEAPRSSADITQPGVDPDAVPTPPAGQKLPLVFQSGDMKGFNLTDEQKATIKRLRQQFLAQVGGGSSAAGSSSVVTGGSVNDAGAADVSSPATVSSSGPDATTTPQVRKWLTAQEQSDEEFVLQFGTEAFNLYQMGLKSN
jgi:hypothetical protein